MTYLPLLTIPILFIFFALLSSRIKKGAWFRPCAICASVFLTWLFLLVFFWDQVQQNPTVVAVLMGMSVTGLMHKLVEASQKRHLRHVWATRLIVILGGFATIIFLLGENFGPMVLSLIATLLLLAIVSFLLQGTTHAQAVESSGHTSLSKKLDNCC